MHTVCLTAAGEVYTFGCNDEGALGRQTADEDECMVPGRVDMAEHIVQISAGDSHTAFLSDDGRVFACGTFRDANGPIGLVSGNKVEKTPVELLPDQTVVKIDSGTDHLVCLTKKGEIFTLGCADQGQLGRVAECFAVRGGRKGIGFLLIPGQVHVRKRGAHFCDVWTGQYTTYAQEEKTGIIYAWGLNNYYQIGFADMENRFVPSISTSFNKSLGWKQISGGQHHAIALDKSGDVYALGRKEYGRLGFGKENLEEKSEPCVIPGLQGKKCSVVNSGTAVSFAVSEDGNIYAWGMGSTRQLGQTEEDDIYEPQLVAGKHLEQRKGLMVSAGGQHTVILATDRSIGDN
ncbi:Regulator of chromosome condensation [Lamellibrachia satsuma]|nr:Regulator of chromosome condensation [Lamellibrachia satsuma]